MPFTQDELLSVNQQILILKADHIDDDTIKREYLEAVAVLKFNKFMVFAVQINPIVNLYPDIEQRYVVGIDEDKFRKDLEQYLMNTSTVPIIDVPSEPVIPTESTGKLVVEFTCKYEEWFFKVYLWNDKDGFYLTAGAFDDIEYNFKAGYVNFYHTLDDYMDSFVQYEEMKHLLKMK